MAGRQIPSLVSGRQIPSLPARSCAATDSQCRHRPFRTQRRNRPSWPSARRTGQGNAPDRPADGSVPGEPPVHVADQPRQQHDQKRAYPAQQASFLGGLPTVGAVGRGGLVWTDAVVTARSNGLHLHRHILFKDRPLRSGPGFLLTKDLSGVQIGLAAGAKPAARSSTALIDHR